MEAQTIGPLSPS